MTDKSLNDVSDFKKNRRHASNIYNYLSKKYLSSSLYLKNLDADDRRQAVSEFHDIDLSADDLHERMQRWVEKYLAEKQVSNMLSALRQRKRRAMGVGKSITISAKAHMMLTALAERDDLTISQVLEKRLKSAYRKL